jgi:hypothetical protein
MFLLSRCSSDTSLTLLAATIPPALAAPTPFAVQSGPVTPIPLWGIGVTGPGRPAPLGYWGNRTGSVRRCKTSFFKYKLLKKKKKRSN